MHWIENIFDYIWKMIEWKWATTKTKAIIVNCECMSCIEWWNSEMIASFSDNSKESTGTGYTHIDVFEHTHTHMLSANVLAHNCEYHSCRNWWEWDEYMINVKTKFHFSFRKLVDHIFISLKMNVMPMY